MLQAHVSSVSAIGIFQVFHADVAKADQEVAYVASVFI
jgi:hypothetical protein